LSKDENKKRTIMNEIIDPVDVIIIYAVYVYGWSEYHCVIPASRRRRGKNVKFTPRNIMANWVFNESGFIVNPENRVIE
jgi:hypothetical protein